ncbi:hypothetical protein [Steroidobacter denitrificans]|nr:hypothetical protein [Steroidobacter denitrificans]
MAVIVFTRSRNEAISADAVLPVVQHAIGIELECPEDGLSPSR